MKNTIASENIATYIPKSFRLLVKIFYISLVTICVVGQTAIFFKKKYENRKDRVAVGIVQVNILLGIPNQQPQHQDPNNVTMCINNQRWNQYLCSNTGTLLFVTLGNDLIIKYLYNYF